MAESVYTHRVVESFDSYFSKEIIEKLRKGFIDKTSYLNFFRGISIFRHEITSQYAQLVLSGDHLINEINDIDTLLGRIDLILSDELMDEGGRREELIIEEVEKLLQDVKLEIDIVRYHISTIDSYFDHDAAAYVIDSNEFRKDKEGTPFVDLLKLICDICLEEYRFSYDENYIRKLLLLRAKLLSYKQSNWPSTVYAVIWAALEKVEFLLSKLALYSKDNTISYNIDYKTDTITLKGAEKKGDDTEFRKHCLYFYDPKRITEKEAVQWLEDANQKDTCMWKLVFLMRYYCKCTKSIKQIDNLIKISERHNGEYLREEGRNKVNDRASKFFINYLYNSRFSFLCKNPQQYSYEDMQKDLNHIAMIQENTGIHNYHPYQKACGYMIDYITTRLNDTSYTDSLKDEWTFLNACYLKLKENKDWCKRHQPYLMQFRYNFSKFETEFGKVSVYCPSSVSRPLKFKEIEERVREIGNAVQWLGLQIGHQEEKEKIVEAHAEISKTKEKIEGMENANIRHMGYFITVTTFLIGLLSIFVGNQGGVSIYEKMEYVTALGIILLLFVGVGYFALTDHISNKKKYWTLFALGIFAAMALGWESHKGFTNLKASKKAQEKEQVVENQAKVIKAKNDTLVIEVNAKVESEGHVVTVTESPKKDNAQSVKK